MRALLVFVVVEGLFVNRAPTSRRRVERRVVVDLETPTKATTRAPAPTEELAAVCARAPREAADLLSARVFSCARNRDWRGTLEAADVALDHKLLGFGTAKRSLKCLASARRPDECAGLMRRLLKSHPPRSLSGWRCNEHLLTVALDACARSADLPQALALFDEARAVGVEVSAVSYSVLIKAMGRRAEFRDSDASSKRALARQVRALLDEMDCSPDIVLMNSAVDAYVRCSALSEARDLLEAMETSTVRPDEITYNTVLKGLARRGEAREALKLARRMRERGLRRTSVTKATIVHALATANKTRLADFLLQQHPQDPSSREESRASTAAYTSVLGAYARVGKRASAFEVLSRMKRYKVERNVVTYTELLRACGARPKLVQGVWDAMIAENLQPNSVTYNAAIGALLEEQPEDVSSEALRKAFTLVAEMRRELGNMSPRTLNLILEALFRDAANPTRLKLGHSLFAEACRHRRPAPVAVTYSIVIAAAGRRGDLAMARDVWSTLLQDSETTVDVVALNSHLDALTRCGALKEALTTLALTTNSSFPAADVVSYSTVIRALSLTVNSFAPERALRLYREMRAEGIAPDTGVARAALRATASLRGLTSLAIRDPRLNAANEILKDLETTVMPQREVDDLQSFAKDLLSQDNNYKRNLRDEMFARKDWNSFESGFKFI